MDHIDVNYKRANMNNKNFIMIDDAIIEEVFMEDSETGYVLITYDMVDETGAIYNQTIRLNVSPRTIIQTPFAERITLESLEIGMHINAVISAAMTRSIPPASQAYRITVLPEEDFIYVTTDRVVDVDPKNGFLYTGNPYDITDQMRFVVSDATDIINRNNERVPLGRVRPGQMVTVEHATFETPSIPPQTTAFRIYIK